MSSGGLNGHNNGDVKQQKTGTQVAGQIAFWVNAAKTLSRGVTLLFWDIVNNRLGIGTSTPAARQHTVGVGNTTATIAQRIDSSTTPNIWQVDDAGRVGQGSLLDTWHTHRASNGTYSSAIIPIGTDPTLNYVNGSTWFVDNTNNILRFQKGSLITDYLFTEDNHRLKNTEVVPRMLEVDMFGNILASRYLNEMGLVTLASDIVSNAITTQVFELTEKIIGNTNLYPSTHPTNPQLITGVIISAKFWARFQHSTEVTSLRFLARIGGSIVADTGVVPISLIDGDNYQIKGDIEITVREMGSSGAVYGNGEISITNTDLKIESLRLDCNSPALSNVGIDTESDTAISIEIIQDGLPSFTQNTFTISGAGITFLYK